MNATSAPVYTAVTLWVQRGLRAGSGVFSARPAWDAAVLADLRARFVRHSFTRGGTFDERWRAQLVGAPDATIQLAGELLWTHLLFPTDTGGDRKRELVHDTLSLADEAVEVPADLDAVLDHGIATSGPAYKARRQSQLSLLLGAAVNLRGRPDRDTLLSDPWACKAWLHALPHEGAQSQREVLMHLLHPAVFEPIVSIGIKRRIVAAFSDHVPAYVDDVDEALIHIRGVLEHEHGHAFRFTDRTIEEQWR